MKSLVATSVVKFNPLMLVSIVDFILNVKTSMSVLNFATLVPKRDLKKTN